MTLGDEWFMLVPLLQIHRLFWQMTLNQHVIVYVQSALE